MQSPSVRHLDKVCLVWGPYCPGPALMVRMIEARAAAGDVSMGCKLFRFIQVSCNCIDCNCRCT
jgi:hypothetical protein